MEVREATAASRDETASDFLMNPWWPMLSSRSHQTRTRADIASARRPWL